ncbi:hypothetical protein KRP22_002022 [Phytophthora ramorum]|uniref:uncharacterized protein n=1 Tax=Phytophthora ramorum TaxID=164328 RepID=UPI0030982119|nr:hypothetical protein KRP23_1327 [Phytophthora ramorum]KAH7509810.1 hypothetical protein KRP22_1306 [Phytophthora ramorum]
MSRWLDEEMSEEKLEPMPPPPAPQAPSHAHPILRTHRRTRYNDAGDGDELLTPQSPPIPHTHPLVALSDESARNVKLQQEAGGMAIHSSQKLFRHRRSIASGKRLDPTFLNRARVEAFTERGAEEPQESDNPFAVETEHSSRAIALQMQRQAEELNKAPVLVPLDEEERTVAATEASARRRELVQAARQAARECRWAEEDGENDGAVMNGDSSALARASERKVRKQLNAKWVQSRQDPSNRPKGPLERPEERGLRETLFRTTASDLLRSGVLYDEADAARNATFGSMRRSQLPVITSGIVGLAGCCFEKYEC